MRCLRAYLNDTGGPRYRWVHMQFEPLSAEATYCVNRIGNSGGQNLDTVAGNLVRATEALARSEPKRASFTQRRYIPALVTTARFFVCSADLCSVDIAKGTLPDVPRMREVDAVRYTKAMPSEYELEYHNPVQDLGETVWSQQRSVLVVTAPKLQSFLTGTSNISPLIGMERQR